MSRDPLVIVGASVRAAAMSALRAGFQPYCIDLFADRDLRQIAQCRRIQLCDYPIRIGEELRLAPAAPWMYTGGLENYPELIEQWRFDRPLLGNRGDALRRVRDPEWLAKHLPYPAVRTRIDDALLDDRYLCKPFRGAGGNGVQWWHGGELPPESCLQQYVDGQSVSGVFVGADNGCWFVGSTLQLVGESWLNSAEFRYCGSIGPRNLTTHEKNQWCSIGQTLFELGRLRGVFGVDAVVSDGQLTVIEVNPRYPASAEVLELSFGSPLLSPQFVTPPPTSAQVIGKVIFYAQESFRFPDSGAWDEALETPWNPWQVAAFADIPDVGEPIRAPDPVITLFATAETAEACLMSLREAVNRFQ